MIQFSAYGVPAPQGSKKFVGMKNGRGMMVESSKRLRPWRDTVLQSALDARIKYGTIEGPVSALIAFTMPKPKSAPKTRQTWPDKAPDLDKLARAVGDSLTDSGIIEDDSKIVVMSLSKMYPNEGLYALDVPGVFVMLRALVDEDLSSVPTCNDSPRPNNSSSSIIIPASLCSI